MMTSQSRLFDTSFRSVLRRCAVKTMLAAALALPMLTYVAGAAPFQTLANFADEVDPYGNATGQAGPRGKVVVSPDRTAYIAFRNSDDIGVPHEYGRVIKVVNGQQTNLHAFVDFNDGWSPEAGLILGGDGNLYGTTSNAGVGTCGTVYKLTTNGQFSVVYSFSGSDGDTPFGELTLGPDGNFYGTCGLGGSTAFGQFRGYGTIFKLTPAGVLTVLYSFGAGSDLSDGTGPTQGVTFGSDGSLYGTTTRGGKSGVGTIFKFTPGVGLTILHDFSSDYNGYAPQGGLIQAKDGNFYGVCGTGGNFSAGGAYQGVIYRITPSGQYSVAHALTSMDGMNPYGTLALDIQGLLYGTTSVAGVSEGIKGGEGTIFKMDTSGAFTVLHTFHSGDPSGVGAPYYFTEGGNPVAPLVLGTDGNLYGVTEAGGNGYNEGGNGNTPSYGGTLFIQPLPRKKVLISRNNN